MSGRPAAARSIAGRRPLAAVAAVVVAVVAAVVVASGAAPAVPAPAAPDSGSLRVSLSNTRTILYPRQPLVVTLSLTGAGRNEAGLDGAAFERGTFAVVDPEGQPPRKVVEGGRAAVGDSAGDPAGPLVVRGFDTVDRRVDLSAWYPGLTSKTGWWEVSWSYGGLRAGPLRIHVVKAYRPGRDLTAVVETELGRMTWELMPETAPEHVKHFVDLARSGFYDGLTFFRVIPGLEAQGGDPRGDGTGAWERVMKPELSTKVKPEEGLIGASRQETSMTSDSMFFITLGPSDFMQGKQTFFARLREGQAVLAMMRRRPTRGDTGMADAYQLNEPVKIVRITID